MFVLTIKGFSQGEVWMCLAHKYDGHGDGGDGKGDDDDDEIKVLYFVQI